jgi:methyltransferase (TIGR00027 family)
MQPKEPSRTAWGAARHRAVHQLLDGGAVFDDPFAVPILGGDIGESHGDPLSREDDNHPGTRALRFFIAARSAYAETKLAKAVANRGVSQLVVLGAGFDTFGLRNPFGPQLRVFEVDHPATQAWKRQRLATMGLAVPEWLSFAGVDFERESFSERLMATGFDPSQRSFVFWLGVTMYLTSEAVDATLAAVARWHGGGEIVFDYAEPSSADMSEGARAAREALARRVAAIGEPLIGLIEPSWLHARLSDLGYTKVEDLSGFDLAERFLGAEFAAAARAASRGRSGAHVLYAST